MAIPTEPIGSIPRPPQLIARPLGQRATNIINAAMAGNRFGSKLRVTSAPTSA